MKRRNFFSVLAGIGAFFGVKPTQAKTVNGLKVVQFSGYHQISNGAELFTDVPWEVRQERFDGLPSWNGWFKRTKVWLPEEHAIPTLGTCPKVFDWQLLYGEVSLFAVPRRNFILDRRGSETVPVLAEVLVLPMSEIKMRFQKEDGTLLKSLDKNHSINFGVYHGLI